MVRSRIVVYALLLLAAYINVSNSGMGMHTAKRYQGEWTTGLSHSVIHSKAGILSQVILNKARASHPKKSSKAGISRPEIHSQSRVPHTEESNKARILHPEIREELRPIDSSLNQQGQVENEVKVKDTDRSMVCPNEKMALYLSYCSIVVSSFALIFILFLFISDRIKYASKRMYANWVRSDECDGEGKEFDVFMCASSADEEYVENFLIPELENRHFKVCYHRSHFNAGKSILDNISECFMKSKRILVFFSNNFKSSVYCIYEFNLAYQLDIENKTRRLITIKDTDLDMSKLEVAEVHYFQTHEYIRREYDIWKLLESSLPRKRRGE